MAVNSVPGGVRAFGYPHYVDGWMRSNANHMDAYLAAVVDGQLLGPGVATRPFGMSAAVEAIWRDLGLQEVFSTLATQVGCQFPLVLASRCPLNTVPHSTSRQ